MMSPPLQSLHPESSLSQAKLEQYGKKSTPELVDS
jgi:hypothetical protein